MHTVDGEGGRALARRLAFTIYVPWFLGFLGRGMLLPVLPLYLRDAGLSYSMVAAVLAATGVGAVLGGLPIGAVASRFGPERLFVAATVTLATTSALLGLSTAVIALVALRLAYGVGAAGQRVSIQMIVVRAAPIRLRGRSMSALGGAVRLGSFVGPIVGGLAVDLAGFTFAFALCGVVTIAGLLPFMMLRTGETDGGDRGPVSGGPLTALRRHRRLLIYAGVGAAGVMTVRAGRNVVVPLIGDDLGMGATAVGVLVAIGTGADLLLFPVSGWLMDRFGRLFSIVPAFSLLGVGMVMLGASSTVAGAVAAGVVMGVGNGMSAGTMLTLGGDLAPAESGPFLSALGMMQDLGVVLGPVLVGWLADAAGLRTSAVVLGVVMFAATAWIVVVLGDTAHPTRPWIVSALEANGEHPTSSLAE